jgi:hypothetical protein
MSKTIHSSRQTIYFFIWSPEQLKHLSHLDISHIWFLRRGSQDSSVYTLLGLEPFCHGGSGVFLPCQWCCQCQGEVMNNFITDDSALGILNTEKEVCGIFEHSGQSFLTVYLRLMVDTDHCDTWMELFLWFPCPWESKWWYNAEKSPHSHCDYAKKCVFVHFSLFCWTSNSE